MRTMVQVADPRARLDLIRLAPVSDGYATVPVSEAFDWGACATTTGAGAWYLVAFRSVLREGVNIARLLEYDQRAFEEAADAPGFIHYFKGPLNERLECLSFCLWDTREHARAAARRTAHVEAVGLIHEMYESYVLEFLTVTKHHGASRLEFEPYGASEPSPPTNATTGSRSAGTNPPSSR